jgi:hypothetical protein
VFAFAYAHGAELALAAAAAGEAGDGCGVSRVEVCDWLFHAVTDIFRYA